jgi:hypothetical protein
MSMLALAGCATEPIEGDEDPPNAAVSQSLTSFSFDSSALAQAPSAALPTTLTLDKLAESNITSQLLATQEKPLRVASQNQLSFFKTSTWEIERDDDAGRVVGFSTAQTGLPVKLSDATLQKHSLDRLGAYGVGSGEVGRVLQRRVMAQDFDGTAPGAPSVHSHKTFVYRAINGIPVEGHRAVITHGVDGAVRKVLVNWPALARSGHALKTQLSVSQIEARAAAALAAEGETTGKASLYWRYLPMKVSGGQVTLKLVASAHIAGAVEPDGTTEEPRIIDIDVSAIP